MKTTLLSILLLVTGTSNVFAQWTIDPANPTAVCIAAEAQRNVQSVADGEGGVYTFWYDMRAETSVSNAWDVYGQHYNAAGEAQWEENGREFINYAGHVKEFSFVRNDDGTMVFTWAINSSPVSTENGVYVRKVDGDLENLWENDVRIFDDATFPNSLSSVRIVASSDYYYIALLGVHIGGAYGLRMNKIDGDGNLQWPFNGSAVSGMSVGFSNYGISSDHNGGVYLYNNTSANAVSGIRCMLIGGESNIQNLWPNWNTVTSGTSGAAQHSGIGDAEGITFCWIGNGPEGTATNVYARRVSATNGLLDWNETTKVICAANGEQSRLFWKKSGNNYYITWSDGRPGIVGNYAIYAQKLSANGVILWEENGVQVANINTYIPYPEFDLDENNSMCITHKAGSGFVAHKVSNDGTVTWGPAGVLVFTNTTAPTTEDFNVVYSEDKFIVIASNFYNIYMNKVQPAQVQISESVSACNTYTTHGETFESSGVYTIEYHPDTILTLNLTIINNESEVDVDGLTLTAVNDGSFQWYNCDTNQPVEGEDGPIFTVTESGSYALQLTNGDCVDMSECVEITIISIDDLSQSNFFSLFPNPGNEILIIQSSTISSKPTEIKIVDMQGKIVLQKNFTATRFELDTKNLDQGIYSIQIITDSMHTSKTWIKTN